MTLTMAASSAQNALLSWTIVSLGNSSACLERVSNLRRRATLSGSPGEAESLALHVLKRALRSLDSNAQVFDLEEFLDAIFGSFAAEARLLHAAERRHLGRDDARIDAD